MPFRRWAALLRWERRAAGWLADRQHRADVVSGGDFTPRGAPHPTPSAPEASQLKLPPPPHTRSAAGNTLYGVVADGDRSGNDERREGSGADSGHMFPSCPSPAPDQIKHGKLGLTAKRSHASDKRLNVNYAVLRDYTYFWIEK